ncbi:P-loop containing nucleoside triphosphate hydrolase protein [Glomus cerebriforme]|uniref:P-loop containing nucleoside triphosphate hydrolase protein n=1 Tax=Glomus cerebriforme TaxID=658196 RepID=A0A397TAX8_9GLOM|nr:P-loop containing nucleoside triphosphate hydrolase protein [Glomus cerebriforme]
MVHPLCPLYNLIKTHSINNLIIRNFASLKENIKSNKISTISNISSTKSNRQEISNRQKFRQINPPPSILKEIEALKLGKPRKTKISRFATKVAIIGRKKLENKLGKLEVEQEELELPHLTFFAGAKIPSSFPPEKVPEVAFVGRSNVGKSSLINALADTTVVRTSDKPGLTRQINFYAAGRIFNMIDMPGYGFAYVKEEEITQWKELIETYISTRKTLRKIFVIVDARHGIKLADIEFLEMLNKKSIEIQIVLTKCDMVIPPDLARRYVIVKEKLKQYKNAIEVPLMVSARKKTGILKLRKEILYTVEALEKARRAIQKKSILIDDERKIREKDGNNIIKGKKKSNSRRSNGKKENARFKEKMN